MPLFINDRKAGHAQRKAEPQLSVSSFVSSARSSDTLTKNSHTVISHSTEIIGRFQELKDLSHPNLCQYIDIVAGKQNRLFFVQESQAESLDLRKLNFSKKDMDEKLSQLRTWTQQILSALSYLEKNGIEHESLHLRNILLDEKDNIKLYDYGLGHMTNYGKNIDFPLQYPNYTPPERILSTHHSHPDSKATLWSLGIMLCEILHATSFWKTTDLGLVFDSISGIRQWSIDYPDAQFWNHEEVTHLDINMTILDFLHLCENRTNNENKDKSDTNQMMELIVGLLNGNPANRPTIDEAIAIIGEPVQDDVPKWQAGPVIRSLDVELEEDIEKVDTVKMEGSVPLTEMPLQHVYYLWKLAGGDVELEMTRVGLLLATPVIELLPRICRVQDGKESGSSGRDTAHLYSSAASILRLDELHLRLDSTSQVDRDMFEWDTNYFMVVDEKDVNFLIEETGEDVQMMSPDLEEEDFIFVEIGDTTSVGRPRLGSGQSFASSPGSTPNIMDINYPASTASTPSIRSIPSITNSNQIPKLPLIQREKAPLYQFHRVRLFTELLNQYPASRNEIIYHAKVDIPPMLRDRVWAAILGVDSDYREVYARIDKITDFGTDRQIEVDVPRCHQYNPLLASSTGHAKLRRLLKAWVADNKELVYWQGLDSLFAPFLVLNFNDEALAFACVEKFIPKFLKNFFLMDNAPVLQEYLTIFRHILSFHDPELSVHLDLIGFMPDLYAIPWFLTLFTHVFPLDKIYHLWDKLLVGPSSIPLFAGVAILRQIRDVLLSSEFNDCITLFSESFPEVDIEKCILSAMTMCKVTPSSVLRRDYRPDLEDPQTIPSDLPSVEVRKAEIAPRLSLSDYIKVMPFGLGLDVRTNAQFKKGHMPSSMNVQPQQLTTFAPILKKLNKKYHTVIADEDSLGSEVAAELVKNGFSRVSMLQGGIHAIDSSQQVDMCTCRPQKQTTTNYKSKGFDPPFVILRCKNTSLTQNR
ncbi:unnamed protein product [Umbelopsis ramanniana]